jgi:hypothetical protein
MTDRVQISRSAPHRQHPPQDAIRPGPQVTTLQIMHLMKFSVVA